MLLQIKSDFNEIYESSSNKLLEKWPGLRKKVLTIMKDEIKNKNILNNLGFASSERSSQGMVTVTIS